MANVFQTCSASFNISEDLEGLLNCMASGVVSEGQAEVADVAAGLDTFFLIFGGALVFFMQTGFAMLCAGCIRAKNVKNVTLWNLLDSCGGGIAFWSIGYAFAYGGDNSGGPKTFIGNQGFFLKGEDISYEFWFFQFAFACALSSIVAGTIAERTKMIAYLFYSFFLVGFVYPVVAHAHWSPNGFLSITAVDPIFGSGAIDLAGSGCVHMSGGVAALVAGIILGPRIGRFYDEAGNLLEEPGEFPPNNVALVFLGTFCLWFGWYGFNPASVLKISTEQLGDVAALVAANTTLAACAGALSAMFTSTFFDHRRTGVATYDPSYTMNGCLTGLVAITSGCATVEPWAAVLIGICAGWFYLLMSKLLVRLRIDDAVDAIPVHMIGGAWGMIATGLFTAPDLLFNAFGRTTNAGWFYEWGRGSGDFSLLGAQLVSVVFIFGWVSVTMGFWFGGLNYLGWYRLDPLEEAVGMDISRHKGAAYDIGDVRKDMIDKLNDSRSQHSARFASKKQVVEADEPENGAETDDA